MASPFDLTGHVALMTGGNGGIGLGMARALASAGADVAVWGRDEAKNGAASTELSALGGGGRVVALRCDVSSKEEVEAAFAATLESLGRVDSCFANAGIGGGAPFVDMTLDEWRRVQRVNSEGAFLTLRAAARHHGGPGRRVVGVAGRHRGGAPGRVLRHSKGGMISMVKGLAVELARHGIRANTVLPGWIETDMTSGTFGWDRFRDNVLPRVSMRRWGVPDDFGPLAVYLASPATSYHTGDTFLIDGGYAIF